MVEELNIRKYKPSDKPFLIEILKLNIPTYFADSEIAELDEYLEHKIELYFVVELSGLIIGAGGINIDGTTGKISWDFITPKFHGKGIGEKLLNHRIELLKSMEHIETIIVRTSQVAYKFYEKSGFVLTEIVTDYWAKGFDLYYMKYVK